MNGVNLEAFPFEYDLTWMSFFQDYAGRTYARYGGRDDSGPESHLNQESLVRTMRSVLELHREHAVQKDSRYEPVATKKLVPADIPPMKPMIAKRNESCIHCHDVKVARLRHLDSLGKLNKGMVFTYPAPSQLGLVIDTKQQNLIAAVESDSPASAAGLQAGDQLLESDGQRLLTYADFTRVLELAPETGRLPLVLSRNGHRTKKQIELVLGWRASKDPSWRSSLHAVGPGAGFWGRPAHAGEREKLNLAADVLALKVTVVWAPHAKSANVQLGDVIIDLDGNRTNMHMRQCHSFLNLHRNWGETIELTALRNGRLVTLTMKLPSAPPHE